MKTAPMHLHTSATSNVAFQCDKDPSSDCKFTIKSLTFQIFLKDSTKFFCVAFVPYFPHLLNITASKSILFCVIRVTITASVVSRSVSHTCHDPASYVSRSCLSCVTILTQLCHDPDSVVSRSCLSCVTILPQLCHDVVYSLPCSR